MDMKLLLVINFVWMMFILLMPVIFSVKQVEQKNNIRLAGKDDRKKPFRLLIKSYDNFRLFYVRELVVHMGYSHNARKFYCLLTFIFMLTTHFLDFMLNNSLRDAIASLRVADTNDVMAGVSVMYYSNYKTPDGIQLTAALIIMMFFFYRIADKLLTFIRSHSKIFQLLCCVVLGLAAMPEHCILLAETLFIILTASLNYPQFNPTNNGPKGGIKIFNIFKYLKVA